MECSAILCKYSYLSPGLPGWSFPSGGWKTSSPKNACVGGYQSPCGTKFMRVLIFAIFAIFPAIRKNRLPQINFKIFPAKIQYQEIVSVRSLTLLSFSFRNKAVYNEILTHTMVLFENMYFYCTYSIKTGAAVYWVLYDWIAKVNSQPEKPICPNRKKLVSAKHKKSPIRKNKLRQKFRATRCVPISVIIVYQIWSTFSLLRRISVWANPNWINILRDK